QLPERMDSQTPTSYQSESYRPEPLPPRLTAPANAPKPKTPPSLQNKYEFIRELGHGAQGRIYLAKRLSDGEEVAIKQLNIASVKNWKEYELFHREADVLQSLDVEGVAKFYEAIECLEDDPPCSYLVQEYIPGYSLAYLLQSNRRFSLNCVYDIVLQMLDILQDLHNHVPPVIHRDIKPSNILLMPLGGDYYKVFLIDFGAVANPQIQGGGSTVAGTFGYMPPEQLTGKPGPASDTYALAAVIVYLLSGVSPADMPVKDFRLIFEPEVQNMPTALVNTLGRMLAPNLDDRLSDIEELKKLFSNYQYAIYSQSANTPNPNDSDYEYALSRVESIGQSGNLDLWQKLPDTAPRECPKAYQEVWLHLEQVDIPDKIKQSTIKSNNILEKAEAKQASRSNHLSESNANALGISRTNPMSFFQQKNTLGCFGVFLGLQAVGCAVQVGFGLIVVLWSALTAVLGNVLTFILIALLVIGAVCLFRYARNTDKRRLMTSLCDTHNFLNSLGYPITNKSKKIKELITYGRKSIATIERIEYYPRPNIITDEHGLTLRHSTPGFKVYYKFNPPDDEREEDLIHVYITQTEPEGHYKVGDPLPILYQIYRDENQIEHVVSMPYPFPLGEVISHSDILYTSSSFKQGQCYDIKNPLMKQQLASHY
ncbi:MAG: serine/threonine protein kinase, partial [Proteobacteria bacterium]|nr:serine/threonine protein kinase [Pseudomonadota bacterium]